MQVKQNQRNEVMRYVKKWRCALFLHEWYIDIVFTEEDKSASAEIRPCPIYKIATIFIHKKFFDAPKKNREHTIVHELAHCISEPSYLAMIDLLNGRLVTPDRIEEIRESLTQTLANVAFRGQW
jgi:hypothetical protein